MGAAVRQVKEVLRLSVSERIQLVEEIWDSIAAHPERLPVTGAQQAELDRRLADYRANPGQGRTWEEVRDSLDES
jgi:putative addiction module component (TIGR02574 family)